MVTGKYQHLMPGDFLYLSQNSDGLPGEGNDMRRAHFGTTPGITHAGDGFTGGGNSPDVISEINFRPSSEAQFAGADKQMQGERYGQPG